MKRKRYVTGVYQGQVSMALLTAVNFEDGLVLLEDGRELAITSWHDAEGRLLPGGDCPEAHHFRVIVPFSGEPPVFLEFNLEAVQTLKPSEIN